jgi:pre-mRNA-splicing helicase BRR2
LLWQVANQVTTSAHRGPRGPAGLDEVKSLRGRMANRMGDLVHRGRPTELVERMHKRAKDAASEPQGVAVKVKSPTGPTSILAAATEMQEQGLYRPRTKDTQTAYEHLLTFVQQQLGEQPREYLASAADEALAILKDESRTDPERKRAAEELMGTVTDRRFHDLVEIGKRITDYHDVGGGAGGGADAPLDENIPVVFEDEDDENQAQGFEVRDDSSDASDEGDEAAIGSALTDAGGGGGEEAGEGAEGMVLDMGLVPVAQIDAYWLQRQVSQFVGDANRAREIAEKLLEILAQKQDATACENKLVELLEFEQFEFVRLLMQNRFAVVWATLYRRAKDETERRAIEEQMAIQEHLAPVLDQLLGKQKKKTAVAAAAASSNSPAAAAVDSGDVAPMELEENVPAHWRIARKVLDLESLAFYEGSRFMANKTVVLPPGTQRIPHKGFEEVRVPVPPRPPADQQPKLVPIEALPAWAQEVFNPRPKPGEKPRTGIKFLNPLQSAVFQKAFFSADNLLIAAPTGSGKTNTAMLCILHEIGLNRRENGTIDLDAFKVLCFFSYLLFLFVLQIVYVAPMKSLVQEMVLNFGQRLACLGITVKELSGDQNLTKQQISETQIIVTTPEKWDVVTRRSGDRTFTQLVRLIIIDEVHLLHDDRGPVLEAVIARSNRQVEETQQMIRLVGLSATLPNYEDVAMLLRVEEGGIFHFGSAHRPVPLELTFLGVDSKKAVQRFRVMNEVCFEQVMIRAGKHQTIIFVHSRKETAKTARFIRDTAMAQDKMGQFLGDYGASREILMTEAPNVKNKDLQELMPFGFGVHHAGMTREDRTLVEELFADGHLQLLVSTATLAWGVNLPAHAGLSFHICLFSFFLILVPSYHQGHSSVQSGEGPLDRAEWFGRHADAGPRRTAAV